MKGRLLALSSAAVLAVYTAGYARTRSAAELLDAEDRRPPMPRPGESDRTPLPPAPSDAKLVPAPAAAGAPSAPAVAAPLAGDRASAGEGADKSVRNADATPEKRATRATADRAANGTSARSSDVASNHVAHAQATEGSQAAALPQTSAVSLVASAATAVALPSPPAPQGALAPSEAPQAPAAPAMPKWKDGRYTGWGTSRHGDLQATIQIEGGRIATASISQCLTRYPCDWIVKLPPQVVQRQSAETDFVSGATESTNALYYAVLQALAKAAQ